MSGLTTEQKIDCNEVFDYFDKNKDDKLSIKELEYALGVLGRKLKQKEYEGLAKQSKSFSREEYLDICKDMVNFDETENKLIESFKILESHEHPGKITVKDLTFVLKSLDVKVTQKDINEIIKEANPDKNSLIDYVAFAKEMLLK